MGFPAMTAFCPDAAEHLNFSLRNAVLCQYIAKWKMLKMAERSLKRRGDEKGRRTVNTAEP
jgi:hypothetical protein